METVREVNRSPPRAPELTSDDDNRLKELVRMCYHDGVMPIDIDPGEMTVEGREVRFKVNVTLDQAKIAWLKEHTVTFIFRAGARFLPRNVKDDVVRAYEDKQVADGSFEAVSFQRGKIKIESPNVISYVAKSREIAIWLVNKGSDELMVGSQRYVFEFKPWLTKAQLLAQRRVEDEQNFWVVAVQVPLDAFFYLEVQIRRVVGPVLRSHPPEQDRMVNIKFDIAPRSSAMATSQAAMHVPSMPTSSVLNPTFSPGLMSYPSYSHLPGAGLSQAFQGWNMSVPPPWSMRPMQYGLLQQYGRTHPSAFTSYMPAQNHMGGYSMAFAESSPIIRRVQPTSDTPMTSVAPIGGQGSMISARPSSNAIPGGSRSRNSTPGKQQRLDQEGSFVSGDGVAEAEHSATSSQGSGEQLSTTGIPGQKTTRRRIPVALSKGQLSDIENHILPFFCVAIRHTIGVVAFADNDGVPNMARSVEGAAMVTKFCKEAGDYRGAIEFLLMNKRNAEGFELAQQHDEMDTYAKFLGDSAQHEEYTKLARYYESKGNFTSAADMYQKCGQPKQALKLYLRYGTPQDIEKAIAMVGKLNDDSLTSQLADFLMGEMDGMEKNHNYLFRLHMALGNYDQAAKTAVIIARQEQELGNYKLAHTQLLETYLELQKQGKSPPSELVRQLMLLHSYVIVKTLVKLGDHESSARMLIRVARNISKFPAHIVPILTSTVIECQRSGLKNTAFQYASMLMRSEYRSSIAPAYKRKIENIVRKPDKSEAEDPLSPCPFCEMLIPETQLECPSCRNTIPYCIASGRHMVLNNWSNCPFCRFPALASELLKVVSAEKMCPMCQHPLIPADVQKIDDPSPILKRMTGSAPPPPTEKISNEAVLKQ
ncbi:hypothetical protein CBR_g19256 [Chara braunii]|uniref:IFT121-like zinc finger domain-containing protein n=1 Tax=Chara braunii TaxID=69332 RepID=A0A388JTS2_CHABU|nr:hypothetical protein CBR_g19256 [Chara braunii]|eukprot:GBG61180.1 hypothetical protein CBR_g19256 [Chara braunii]